MHYCCAIITKEFPTKEVLTASLKPFHEDVYYDAPEENRARPQIMWDWWQVGGRYNGQLKLRIDKDNDKYQWRFYARAPRAGRLFRSYLLETMKDRITPSWVFAEEDFFSSMGWHDGFLYVDGAPVDDVQNLDDVGCYYLIDKDGNGFGREYFDGDTFVQNEGFDELVKQAIEDGKGCYICIVDLHN